MSFHRIDSMDVEFFAGMTPAECVKEMLEISSRGVRVKFIFNHSIVFITAPKDETYAVRGRIETIKINKTLADTIREIQISKGSKKIFKIEIGENNVFIRRVRR